MNRFLGYLLITVYSIFIGSQITEGLLLVPYWKSLSPDEFYDYYSQFGLLIGRFYTVLTIIAACISIATSLYCMYVKSKALRDSLVSSVFILLCIAVFYLYFKDANQQFFTANLNPVQLKSALETWEYLHWFRVFLEFLALIFLIRTLNTLTKKGFNNRLQSTLK